MNEWTEDTRNRLERAMPKLREISAMRSGVSLQPDDDAVRLGALADDIAAALAELDRLKTVADAAVGSNVLQGERLASACKFLVGGEPDGFPVFVEQRHWNPEAWAVKLRGDCLNKSGEWEWEPMPSSRDDAFFARTRWPSAEEAIKAFREAKWKS